MYKFNEIRDIHIELTTKCQARCPMCPRRINGGILNPLISLKEIDLKTFQQWIDKELIRQLNSIFFCGNLGDPIIAKDCLEIIKYVQSINPVIRLSMHTNGSARETSWWKNLASTKTRVVFGIDGLEDTHSLYRIDTDWQKIINNAATFISAGGYAEWHMLVFEHNENQIESARKLSQDLGFADFKIKHTSRFTKSYFPVLDDHGTISHLLKPTKTSSSFISAIADAQNEENKKIVCKAKKYSQIYVAADGTVSPCCWLDYKWHIPNSDYRINYMQTIGVFPNLNESSMQEIFDSMYFQKIENTWSTNPLKECSKQCGSFDKLGAQFEN